MKNAPFKIFVLEDDEWYNKLLVHSISLNPDYAVRNFFTAGDFFAHIREKPDVVTIDYRLPDSNGEEVLDKIKQVLPDTEVIVISEQENIQTAIDLLKNGAYDYIVKDKNIKDRLLTVINKIHHNSSLKSRIQSLEKELQKKHDFTNTIIGNSAAMIPIGELIQKAITSTINVTLTGETGTGKEVVAKAIHYSSEKKNKPFVTVNMAAIPAELVESELFGHEKGAFTGALTRRIGKFEEANGGTLFLDEIAELPIAFQAKLLRALQEKEIVRIGSNQPVKVDCRIIVATHRNLKDEVKKGSFREDLFFRLFGLTIHMPPLRDRGKDILVLAQHFITDFCKQNKQNLKTFSNEAQQKLMGYHFPGNVRELKSVVELAVIMSNSDIIDASSINLSSGDTLSDTLSDEMTLREYEMKIIKTYMKKYDDNIKLVAQKLDIGLSTLYRLLKDEKETND